MDDKQKATLKYEWCVEMNVQLGRAEKRHINMSAIEIIFNVFLNDGEHYY